MFTFRLVKTFETILHFEFQKQVICYPSLTTMYKRDYLSMHNAAAFLPAS